MKTIKLTLGKVAIVDNDDFDKLNQWKWNCVNGYAARLVSRKLGKRVMIYMHREILGTPDGMECDHINSNRLDNRKQNLRICNRSQNQANRSKSSNNTSGYKGVNWHKVNQKWRAKIKINGRSKYLGCFTDIEDAAKAYEKAAIEYFGEFARV
jgi:hypothetical protein